MTDGKKITNFISQVVSKNYHGANKYLHAIVESKMKTRIASAVKSTKLFY